MAVEHGTASAMITEPMVDKVSVPTVMSVLTASRPGSISLLRRSAFRQSILKGFAA